MRRIKVQSETSGSMSWENGVATNRDGKSVGKADFGRKMRKWASDVEFQTPLKRLRIWGPTVKLPTVWPRY